MAALFLTVYGLARLALGPLKVDPPFLFGLQIEQLLALGCVAAGVLLALRTVRRVKVTLFSKRDCHLCESAVSELTKLQTRYPHQLEVVDITANRTLEQLYGERIPVVRVNGREYGAPLSRAILEKALSGRA